ncbi:YciI family protein [Rhodococcus sp. G-MC3]|uniref:YciI family protein n=1 Tax=Rhodococcus sp. G-MC3 TaxID=3046209 RepID=UPI0024BBB651|nr:YciI family protein [Rhodococcus sp. G-MC3]MDJ0391712.1 YciI family protein [Rhodococcus sp. G-MC3]
MPMFVVEYSYTPETSSGRDDHRTDHRAWIQEMVRRHTIRSSGPLADHSGAMFIVQSVDADTVARMFARDPFARAGLVESVRIAEWHPTAGDAALREGSG